MSLKDPPNRYGVCSRSCRIDFDESGTVDEYSPDVAQDVTVVSEILLLRDALTAVQRIVMLSSSMENHINQPFMMAGHVAGMRWILDFLWTLGLHNVELRRSSRPHELGQARKSSFSTADIGA
jgi:hypothetical protein